MRLNEARLIGDIWFAALLDIVDSNLSRCSLGLRDSLRASHEREDSFLSLIARDYGEL